MLCVLYVVGAKNMAKAFSSMKTPNTTAIHNVKLGFKECTQVNYHYYHHCHHHHHHHHHNHNHHHLNYLNQHVIFIYFHLFHFITYC